MAMKQLIHVVSFYFIIIVTLLTIQAFAPSSGCPPKENIFPQCTCTSGIVISCKVGKIDEIPLWAFRGYTISRLELTTYQENDKFFPHSFMGLTIKFIELKSFQLKTLSLMEDFQGLEKSLTGLSVVTSKVDNITASELKQISQEFSLLVTLNMEGSKCLVNTAIQYIGIPNLKNFICTGRSGNENFKTVPSHLLADFTKLEKVELSGIGFQSIENNVFPSDARYLRIINLRDNNLQELDIHLFQRLPVLKEVYLQGNKLTSIDKSVFQPVWNQLTHLYLNCNSVVCDCQVAWILFSPKKPANFIPPTCHGQSKIPNTAKFAGLILTDIDLEDLCPNWGQYF
ncbi:leucine-rich repeats and immunoglobulin-like domains protein sma-10 [Limulus polyphemus]|uniref:Leucine-rich repeats and immunoglobulin-like domains protein sma-10 n=1 Tax=Limulus polyphemus TaxID=6850 RepID=A0ABM1S4I0_LIMPO|nr:leucine-rich repeats and immunoglobulin-like domains protein sma-10 [Limulus polyphemus]